MDVVRVFRAKERDVIDCYSVVIGRNVYGMNEYPDSPSGFNQFCGTLGEISIDNLGRELKRIPARLKNAIKRRMED